MDFMELYDLRKDPTEVRNVYPYPGYAVVRAQMEQLLSETRKKVGAK